MYAQSDVLRAVAAPVDDEAVGVASGGANASGAATPPRLKVESTARAKVVRVAERYVVLDKLGEGGLGEVHTAYDSQLHRRIALKFIKHNSSPKLRRDSGAQGRLYREAQAMAQINHSNVVTIYDVGMYEGRVYLAMELVNGLDLGRWLVSEQRTWKTIRDVFVHAARGLHAAHAQGLVHRDFKPANVLIGDKGEVKVADFGLARRVDDLESMAEVSEDGGFIGFLSSRLTEVGMVIGTPRFMAPEQFRRDAEIGPEADQYAFCVALWEALFLEHPYGDEDFRDMASRSRAGKIIAPADRRGAPPWMERAIRRGLSANPKERHASMLDLVDALERDRRVRRHRIFAGLLGAMVLAGGTVAVVQQMTQVERAAPSEVSRIADQAQLAASRAAFVYPPVEQPKQPTAYIKVLELEGLAGAHGDGARKKASELRREFSGTLLRLGNKYWELPGGRPFAAEYYAAALLFDPEAEQAAERLPLGPVALAAFGERAAKLDFTRAELVAGTVLVALADEEEDEEALDAKVQGVLDDHQGLPASTVTQLDLVLRSLRRKPRSTKSRNDARRGVEDAEVPERDEEVALVDETLARDDETGEEPEAVGDAEGEAEEVPDESSAKRRADVSGLLSAARERLERRAFADAERFFSKALERSPGHGAALAGLAEVAFERGAYQRAVSYGERAIAASPRRGRYRILLGDAYLKTLRYQSARRQYEAAAKYGMQSLSRRRLERLEELIEGH